MFLLEGCGEEFVGMDGGKKSHSHKKGKDNGGGHGVA